MPTEFEMSWTSGLAEPVQENINNDEGRKTPVLLGFPLEGHYPPQPDTTTQDRKIGQELAKHSEASSAVEVLYKTASRRRRDLAARFV